MKTASDQLTELKNLILAKQVSDFFTPKENDLILSGKHGLREDVVNTKREEKNGKKYGMLCYLVGRAEPMRLYPLGNYVIQCCFAKKLLANVLKDSKWKLPLHALNFRFYINHVHFFLKDYQLPIEKYSQPVQEVWRALENFASKSDFNSKVRDVICFILEYDLAYRYRFQDVISCLNKENVKKNVRKELMRLFGILMDRDYKEQNAKWIVLKLVIWLNANRVKEFLEEIDLKEVEMSREDLYWTNNYVDYKFRGKTPEERIEINRSVYGDDQVKFDLGLLQRSRELNKQ